MAYQAKKRKRFVESFELIDENGNLFKTLHVELDADDMVTKINRKYTALCQVLKETTEAKRKSQSNEEIQGCIETLGNAVIHLFEAVFGVEDTKTIVEFYDNRYIEMCNEVVPFITKFVIPRLYSIKKQNQKSILKPYNRFRR